MAISQHLRRKLQEALGADAAADLVSQIEDTSTLRGDLGELRHEMQMGFARVEVRFEKLEGRFEKLEGVFEARLQAIDSRFVAFENVTGKAIEKGLREQTRFFSSRGRCCSRPSLACTIGRASG
jgi:hypothetical protein